MLRHYFSKYILVTSMHRPGVDFRSLLCYNDGRKGADVVLASPPTEALSEEPPCIATTRRFAYFLLFTANNKASIVRMTMSSS